MTLNEAALYATIEKAQKPPPRCGSTEQHPHVVAPRALKDARAALAMGAADAKLPCRNCGRLVSLSHARQLA